MVHVREVRREGWRRKGLEAVWEKLHKRARVYLRPGHLERGVYSRVIWIVKSWTKEIKWHKLIKGSSRLASRGVRVAVAVQTRGEAGRQWGAGRGPTTERESGERGPMRARARARAGIEDARRDVGDARGWPGFPANPQTRLTGTPCGRGGSSPTPCARPSHSLSRCGHPRLCRGRTRPVRNLTSSPLESYWRESTAFLQSVLLFLSLPFCSRVWLFERRGATLQRVISLSYLPAYFGRTTSDRFLN